MKAVRLALHTNGVTILIDIPLNEWGAAHMRHDVVYNEQILAVAQDPFQNVATVLICPNLLLRTGISHILSGTRFAMVDGLCDDPSNLPALDDTMPVLFMICENRATEELVAMVDTLKTQHPLSRVVVLADAMDPDTVIQLCGAGMDGFCATSMDRHALVKALEIVILGETYIPASIGLALLERARQSRAHHAHDGAGMPVNTPAEALDKLSEREAQILRCLTRGSSNKVIARELGVAEATVKVHIKAILRKVKATNRTQAAIWATGHFDLAQDNVRALAAGE
ncbi:response regulator containing a CheY-like receiver domain and an HTH DNA-binding domain [Microvirga lotononidis]|uniref:Response regulator containing a CheY-like receiver domain and an HTH DNA-binding domain n=2 Tax=Microvirga lotononidis TaxID=864069 RepID=I4YT59_9HYPH|nr:response regulator containing a CheY-like receiver domain and an HTH DNA-binding domain [Microvirga lotononidis]